MCVKVVGGQLVCRNAMSCDTRKTMHVILMGCPPPRVVSCYSMQRMDILMVMKSLQRTPGGQNESEDLSCPILCPS